MMAGVAVVAVLAACSSTSKTTTGGSTTAGSTGSSDKPLLIARGMDVNSLDPSRAYCDTCQIYLTAVYETLIGLAPDNKTLEPRLALSWTGNDDQTQFTFKLDPKAKFADGSQVTSADVKYSWQRLGGLKGSASYLVGQIKSIAEKEPAAKEAEAAVS